MNKKINYKYLNLLLILGIIYLLFLMSNLWMGFFTKLLNIILPFLISFCIAYALFPALEFLMSKKIPKLFSILIIIISIVLIFGLTFYFAIPVFFNQTLNLFSNLTKASANLADKYNINTSDINNIIDTYLNKVLNLIETLIKDGTIIGILNKSVSFITRFIIIFISSIYFLVDMPKIKLKIKNYLYKTNKKRYEMISKVNYEIYSYLKGLLIFMIIQLFEYTFLFFIIGHPNFLLIGILASITTIIPYFGGLITNIIALIIASVVSPRVFILSLIITLVFPNIDGYIISPKIYGKTNRLPALLTIFSVFAGGALFGFIGIVIAVPLTIVIMSLIKSNKENIINKINNIKEKI